MGLAALSDFHLAAARGGSRGRLRISAPLLFGHVALIVQSERLQSAALQGDLVDVEQLTRLANARRAPFYLVGGQ
jgi:hypothetical protein